MRLDHVQVAAPPGCEAAARAFYGGLLGLPELDKPEPMRAGGGVWFAVGAQELHVGVVGDGFAPATKAHPGLAVDADADARRARRAAGGRGRAGVRDRGPHRSIPGVRRFATTGRTRGGNRLIGRSILAAGAAPGEDAERPER